VTRNFNEIYSRDALSLYRYLRRLTLSRVKAEDLLQDVFLKLHVQLETGAPLDNVRAWLFRVATNLARDREKVEARTFAREQRYGSDRTVVHLQAYVDYRHDVRRALARLPPRMRQMLLLHAEGFTYKEMAEIAGIEPGYAGVLLQRARAEFRRVFEQDYEQKRHDPSGSVR
jgi:RNA polymerase sigma-70 factor (ECF subfamily)